MMLTQDLLDELERRWRDNDAAILHWLQPGLTDEQIDELTAPLSFRLPEEARRWWRWHDGVSVDAPAGTRSIGGGPTYIPLAEAVESTLWFQADPPVVWSNSWLVMTQENDPLVIDCSGDFDGPTPVHPTFLQQPEPLPAEHSARSLGELVSLWIEAIDCGAYTYDKDVGDWHWHADRLTPRMRGRGLV